MFRCRGRNDDHVDIFFNQPGCDSAAKGCASLVDANFLKRDCFSAAAMLLRALALSNIDLSVLFLGLLQEQARVRREANERKEHRRAS